MKIHLRLWVCNQHLVDTDSDCTDDYLDAAGWHRGAIVSVSATNAGLLQWWDNVYLPLRQRVAQAGWGELGEGLDIPPPLLVAIPPHHDIANEMLRAYCEEDTRGAWIHEVLQTKQEHDVL